MQAASHVRATLSSNLASSDSARRRSATKVAAISRLVRDELGVRRSPSRARHHRKVLRLRRFGVIRRVLAAALSRLERNAAAVSARTEVLRGENRPLM